MIHNLHDRFLSIEIAEGDGLEHETASVGISRAPGRAQQDHADDQQRREQS